MCLRLACTGTHTGLLLGAAQGQDTALRHQGWVMKGTRTVKTLPFTAGAAVVWERTDG